MYRKDLALNNYQRWIYSDGDNIIIIIIIIGFLGLRFKLVLRWLCWYFVGCIGISLVVIHSLNVDGK